MTTQYRFVVDKMPNFERAACKSAPSSVFFPRVEGRSGRVSRSELAEANLYCSSCPIRQECLEYACRTDSVGIWGGRFLSEHITRRLRDKHGWSLQREVVTDVG